MNLDLHDFIKHRRQLLARLAVVRSPKSQATISVNQQEDRLPTGHQRGLCRSACHSSIIHRRNGKPNFSFASSLTLSLC